MRSHGPKIQKSEGGRFVLGTRSLHNSKVEDKEMVAIAVTLGMAFGPVGALVSGILCIFICSDGNVLFHTLLEIKN